MKYVSTRGQTEPHSFREVVAAGLAPDGGLFIPETLPNLGERYQSWKSLDYPNLAAAFFKIFASDIDFAHINEMTYRAYKSFNHQDYAPLKKLDEATQARIDYAEFRDPATLELAPENLEGPTLLAIALQFDADPDGQGAEVRLIDNRVLDVR